MATPHHVVAIAGSLRKESFTLKIANALAKLAPATLKLEVITPHGISFFNQDLEAAPPADWLAFRDKLQKSHGVLFVTPEYNRSIPGVLKNAIDWMSRAAPGEPPLAAFEHKFAALMSASPGALGGARGLVVLRMLLGNIKVLVLPGQCSLAKAHEAFGPNGQLVDPKLQAQALGVGAELARMLLALQSAR